MGVQDHNLELIHHSLCGFIKSEGLKCIMIGVLDAEVMEKGVIDAAETEVEETMGKGLMRKRGWVFC